MGNSLCMKRKSSISGDDQNNQNSKAYKTTSSIHYSNDSFFGGNKNTFSKEFKIGKHFNEEQEKEN
jgi:hypothetical protein